MIMESDTILMEYCSLTANAAALIDNYRGEFFTLLNVHNELKCGLLCPDEMFYSKISKKSI